MQLDHVFEVAELEYVNHWSENFVLHDFCSGIDLDDCREHVVSVHALNLLTSVKDLASLFLDFLDAIQVVLEASLGVEGTQEGIWVKRVAHLVVELRVCLYHALHEGVVVRFVDESPALGGASLAASSDSTENSGSEGKFYVCIRHNNCGVVSTKFENGLSESAVYLGTHISSNLC